MPDAAIDAFAKKTQAAQMPPVYVSSYAVKQLRLRVN